ncbi:MAG: PorT family protein [Chitinophagaceae bacterium]|nr:PorT family protein [Chitinophagaceae bacterium]
MKSLILSTALMLSFFSVANAQGFSAGLKLGTNINKIQGQSFSDKFTYGYSAGAFMEVKLGKKWGIQAEGVFNQVTTDTSDRFSELYKINAGKISNIKLNYLSIPLLLNYHVSKGIVLQAGPQYGILLNQTKNLLENGRDAFKQGDFSLLGGLQLQLASIRIYGRYAIGLNNLNDIDNRDKWRNQSIQLGIGFAIL